MILTQFPLVVCAYSEIQSAINKFMNKEQDLKVKFYIVFLSRISHGNNVQHKQDIWLNRLKSNEVWVLIWFYRKNADILAPIIGTKTLHGPTKSVIRWMARDEFD